MARSIYDRNPDEGFNLEGLKAAYKRLRDEERGANQQAQQENPGSYLAGSLAASVPQALSIASVAKASPALLGTTTAGQAVRTAGAGGALGATRGAGQAEELKDVPREALKSGAVDAAISGAIPLAGPALQVGGRMLTGSSTAPVAAAVKSAGVGPAGITAGLGAFYGGVMHPVESTDPYSEGLKRVRNGALGALGGAVSGWSGAKLAQGMGATPKLLGKMAQGVGGASPIRDVAVQTIAQQPFSVITDYLKQALGTKNPAVQGAAKQLQEAVGDGLDDKKNRQAAMAGSSTQEGRAVGNSTSPLNDGSD